MKTSEPSISTVTWTVVSQCKSDRVVYFTDDSQYQPPMEGDWYYCSTYIGELPQGMTLRNCWGWRFRGSQFLDARSLDKATGEEKLMESNRKALLRLLKEKIDDIRRPFSPACIDGNALRQLKLLQAKAWIKQASETDKADDHSFSFLSQVAQARSCSLQQAARLIVSRAAEQEEMWLETERFREQMTQIILKAQAQSMLLEVREWLLDAVYPELSYQFKCPRSNTEPIDTSKPLGGTARQHEISRLKSQLRDVINTRRKNLHSAYVLGEQIWQHKLKQAQQWKSHSIDQKTSGITAGYDLLASYAQARNIDMDEAAQALLDAASHAVDTLTETERAKDRLLARIEQLATFNDVQQIQYELESMGLALPMHASEMTIS